MKLLKRILRITGLTVAIILLLSLIWWIWPSRTPGIKSDSGKSVASLEYIDIGGLEQSVLIRSENIDNPIILFLHGGPGMPMMYLAHEFQRPLESRFTVVQWDRRGAGKTYSRNVPTKESMNVQQLIDDTFQLIDTLRSRYRKEKIILAGHSFGTYIGSICVSQKPELFSAYLSIGQVVDDSKASIIQENFVRNKAEQLDRTDILEALDSSPKPYLENWLFEFGAELKEHQSFFPLIWSGMKAPEYRLKDAINVGKGSSFSSSHMKLNVLSGSINDEITKYEVPVFFFVGRYDYTTPHELITEYYQKIEAPKKEIIYFDNSAHFPFFEEPESFCEELIKILN